MDLDNLKKAFRLLRHPLSAILRRLIELEANEATRETLLQELKSIRKEFVTNKASVPSFIESKWTPLHSEKVFAQYGNLLCRINAAGPVLQEVCKELVQALSSTPPSPSPDDCQRLDRLLAANVTGTWPAVRSEYLEMYRDRVRQGLRVQKDADLATDHLCDQIRQTYTVARNLANNNDDVLGALVESRIRELIESLVQPMRVSSGGVAGLPSMKQIDAIIWNPHLGPAAIEVGGVAIVPRGAVLGLVEVKASYDTDLEGFGLRILELVAEITVAKEISSVVGGPTVAATGVVVWSKFGLEEFKERTGGMAILLFSRNRDRSLMPHKSEMDRLLRFIKHDVLHEHLSKVHLHGAVEGCSSNAPAATCSYSFLLSVRVKIGR